MALTKEGRLLRALKTVRPMQAWSYLVDEGVFTLETGSTKRFSVPEICVMLEADKIEFERKIAIIEEAVGSL